VKLLLVKIKIIEQKKSTSLQIDDFSLGFLKKEDIAEFSNIADIDIYVNKAIHRATIDFTQEGIKAVATTAFRYNNVSADIYKSEEVKLDRPFIFLIRDK